MFATSLQINSCSDLKYKLSHLSKHEEPTDPIDEMPRIVEEEDYLES